ncbi:sugar nucleotide-binding protein [Vibrio mexicanus]|nr:sugar nucleotide-binding protein [Vibrio mexicanus]
MSTTAFPTAARRPSFSVLDKASTEEAIGLQTQHWRLQLSAMLDEINIK